MKNIFRFALILVALLFSTAALSQASVVSKQSSAVTLTPGEGDDGIAEGFLAPGESDDDRSEGFLAPGEGDDDRSEGFLAPGESDDDRSEGF